MIDIAQNCIQISIFHFHVLTAKEVEIAIFFTRLDRLKEIGGDLQISNWGLIFIIILAIHPIECVV